MVTRLILAAALLLSYVVVVRIVRAGTPTEPEDEMATAFLDSPPIRIRLPEQATVWRH